MRQLGLLEEMPGVGAEQLSVWHVVYPNPAEALMHSSLAAELPVNVPQPETPVPGKHQAIADLVKLDARGRAHFEGGIQIVDGEVIRNKNGSARSINGRFMSKHELGLIALHKDQIREGLEGLRQQREIAARLAVEANAAEQQPEPATPAAVPEQTLGAARMNPRAAMPPVVAAPAEAARSVTTYTARNDHVVLVARGETESWQTERAKDVDRQIAQLPESLQWVVADNPKYKEKLLAVASPYSRSRALQHMALRQGEAVPDAVAIDADRSRLYLSRQQQLADKAGLAVDQTIGFGRKLLRGIGAKLGLGRAAAAQRQPETSAEPAVAGEPIEPRTKLGGLAVSASEVSGDGYRDNVPRRRRIAATMAAVLLAGTLTADLVSGSGEAGAMHAHEIVQDAGVDAQAPLQDMFGPFVLASPAAPQSTEVAGSVDPGELNTVPVPGSEVAPVPEAALQSHFNQAAGTPWQALHEAGVPDEQIMPMIEAALQAADAKYEKYIDAPDGSDTWFEVQTPNGPVSDTASILAIIGPHINL